MQISCVLVAALWSYAPEALNIAWGGWAPSAAEVTYETQQREATGEAAHTVKGEQKAPTGGADSRPGQYRPGGATLDALQSRRIRGCEKAASAGERHSRRADATGRQK